MTSSNGSSSSSRSAGSARFGVPGRVPDAQLAAGRRERVGEHQRALLGKPQRGLHPAAAVVERDEAARAARCRARSARARSPGRRRASKPRPERAGPVAGANRSTSRTWSGLRTTAAVGGLASSRSHTASPGSVGAIGSSTRTSPRDSTQVEVTSGSQSDPGPKRGARPARATGRGATSRISAPRARLSQSLPGLADRRSRLPPVHTAGGQGKSGASPARSRHCDRAKRRRETASQPLGRHRRSGRRDGRPGSQETCPRPANHVPRGKGGSQ